MTTWISHRKSKQFCAAYKNGGGSAPARDAVPAYVVAPNATLTEIARRRPANPDELVEIKGFGPTRVEKYGDEILAVLGAEVEPPKSD